MPLRQDRPRPQARTQTPGNFEPPYPPYLLPRQRGERLRARRAGRRVGSRITSSANSGHPCAAAARLRRLHAYKCSAGRQGATSGGPSGPATAECRALLLLVLRAGRRSAAARQTKAGARDRELRPSDDSPAVAADRRSLGAATAGVQPVIPNLRCLHAPLSTPDGSRRRAYDRPATRRRRPNSCPTGCPPTRPGRSSARGT